jgi:hypothetical protein
MIKPKNVIMFEGPTVLFSAIGTPSSSQTFMKVFMVNVISLKNMIIQ